MTDEEIDGGDVVKIVPESVSALKSKGGRRVWFTVRDVEGCVYTCFNSRLRDAFGEGEEIEVVVSPSGRFKTISRVVGFDVSRLCRGDRLPKNEAEAKLYDIMKVDGWELTKRGWPDFACFKDGEMILVEVKPKRSHRLKFWQHRVLQELAKKGVCCYRWDPDEGFTLVQSPVELPP